MVVLGMTNTTPTTPSTSKVRRDIIGGKRGAGKRLKRRIKRPDPRKITTDVTDSKLTSNAGLALFGAFVRDLGLDDELEREFGHLTGTSANGGQGDQINRTAWPQARPRPRSVDADPRAGDRAC